MLALLSVQGPAWGWLWGCWHRGVCCALSDARRLCSVSVGARLLCSWISPNRAWGATFPLSCPLSPHRT